MNKIKNIIIILGVIILIIIIIILLLIKHDSNKSETLTDVITYQQEYKIEKVTQANDFYTIKNICLGFAQNILYEERESIYNKLSPEYINECNVTKDNIVKKLKFDKYDINKNEYYTLDFIVKNMYQMKKDDSVTMFFIYGYVIDNIQHEKSNFNLMIKTNNINNSFYIFPEEYMKEKQYVDLKVDDSFEFNDEKINNNDYNQYDDIVITQEELLKDYFNLFINKLIYNEEEAYELLDNEYKSKRFGDVSKFNKYVDENIKKILNGELDKYNVKTYNNYTQYICIDTNGNYYIFNETAVMEYSVILDTYTIDMPEFIDKYNSTNEQGKCALNIQKFMQAIDAGDYEYAYSHLSETFRNNYFKKQSDFENYAKENFYGKNSVEYANFENKTTVYTYKLNITNEEDKSQKTSKTFVVKLNEETGFELSFNV